MVSLPQSGRSPLPDGIALNHDIRVFPVESIGSGRQAVGRGILVARRQHLPQHPGVLEAEIRPLPRERVHDVRRVTANALDASFVGEAAKDDVRRRYFGWVDG